MAGVGSEDAADPDGIAAMVDLEALAAAQEASHTLTAHEEIIRTKLLAGSELVEGVVALHNAHYREPAAAQTGARVRLLRLEFDDLYTFGKNNVIDFTSLEGVISSVNGPNHSGKSSIIRTLLYALYEGCPDAKTIKNIIHNSEPSCSLVLDFEIDGRPGRIEKGFVRSKASGGQSRYSLHFAGENLGGGVATTTGAIQQLVGSSEVALLSSFQTQFAGREFIHVTGLKRKELFVTALSLGKFKEIDKAVGVERAEANAKVNVLTQQFNKVSLSKLIEMQSTEQDAAQTAESDAEQFLEDEAQLRAQLLAQAAICGTARALVAEKRRAILPDDGPRLDPDGITREQCEHQIRRWTQLIQSSAMEPPSSPDIVRLDVDQWSEPPTEADLPARLRAAELELIAAKAIYAVAPPQSGREAAATAARVEAAGLELEAARVRLHDVSIAPTAPLSAPTAPRPIGEPISAHERNGERPTEANVAAAVAMLATAPAARETTAVVWDPNVYAKLVSSQESLASINIDPLPPDIVESYVQADAEASAALTAAHARMAGVSPTWAQPHVVVLDGPRRRPLEALDVEVRTRREWLAAAAHTAAIRARHAPRPGCPGCEEMAALLAAPQAEAASAVATAEAELQQERARVYSDARLHLEDAKRTATSTAATLAEARSRIRHHTALAAVRKRLAELEVSRQQHEWQLLRQQAEAVLECANYWLSHDRVAWRQYDEAVCRHTAERARALASARSEAAAAEVAYTTAVSANQTALGADQKSREAKLSYDTARAAHETLGLAFSVAQEGRRRMAGALTWWRAAERAVAARTAAAEASAAAVASRAATEREQILDAELKAASRNRLLAEKRVSHHARESDRLAQCMATEHARVEALHSATSQAALLEAYQHVLRAKGGIADILLEQARPTLNREINRVLYELGAEYKVELTDAYDLLQQYPSGAARPVESCGGFEQFALGLAIRLALWRLIRTPKLSALFIDEGFESCDAKYLPRIASALEALVAAPDGPRLVFIITHSDALKIHVERMLDIEVHATGSRVVNAAPRPRERPPCDEKETDPDTAPALVERGRVVNVFVPDPDTPGHVWCTICEKSLKPGSKRSHLTSAHHIAAVTVALAATQ
jgi:DNA repair exonuclease SbcCD ATPase subunit